MYPVKLGFDEAIKRIKVLVTNKQYAESLVTAVFTCEKTFRRTLKQLIVSAGFKSVMAEKIIANLKGLDSIQNAWEIYDPKNRKLDKVIGIDNWKSIKEISVKRNKLVHGERVYKLDECKADSLQIVKILEQIKKTLDAEYGYSGWTNVTIRIKSKLHIDPRVKIVIIEKT